MCKSKVNSNILSKRNRCISKCLNVADKLHISVRTVAEDGCVSTTLLHRILKFNKVKPFNIHLIHYTLHIYDANEFTNSKFAKLASKLCGQMNLISSTMK